MMKTNTLAPLLAPLVLGLVAAVPTTHSSITPGAELVGVQLFNGAECTAPDPNRLSLTNTECWILPGQYLRVVAHGDARLKYNSLHVYKTQNCTGGWTLQPLDDACSDVSAFDSIRVVLDA
ncbi:hypothetical protein K505DRAFT_360399 [Melanomma pulvis-pyrius CBS 109.77]|uniref:Uncharacterized protein n=1 Tax=Melanomma pulvis-pyrius CBS 109.77 TaxID=1314802 RepID=A0A6A6XFU5_9PLEO|nr:hypothetical protein K505DRAFT_360399 [Melanomma pulvis-pyrius CBS 109.77]